MMTVKVSVRTAEKLKQAAVSDHSSVSQIIDRLVDRMFEQPEAQSYPVPVESASHNTRSDGEQPNHPPPSQA